MADQQKQNQDGSTPPKQQAQANFGQPQQAAAKDPKKDAQPRHLQESTEGRRRKK